MRKKPRSGTWRPFRSIPNVWQNLEGSPDARIDAIFGIVRSLVRANQVVGQDRRNILNKIEPLFKFTQSKRESETRYYQGLYRFLDADIGKSKTRAPGSKKQPTGSEEDCRGEFELERANTSEREASSQRTSSTTRGGCLFRSSTRARVSVRPISSARSCAGSGKPRPPGSATRPSSAKPKAHRAERSGPTPPLPRTAPSMNPGRRWPEAPTC